MNNDEKKGIHNDLRSDPVRGRYVRRAKAHLFLLLRRAVRFLAVLAGGASIALLYAVVQPGGIAVAHATVATSSQETIQITDTASFYPTGRFLSTTNKDLAGFQLSLIGQSSNCYTNDGEGEIEFYDGSGTYIATTATTTIPNADAGMSTYLHYTNFLFNSIVPLNAGSWYQWKYTNTNAPGCDIEPDGNGLPWFNGVLTCAVRYSAATSAIACAADKHQGAYLVLYSGYNTGDTTADTVIQTHPSINSGNWIIYQTATSTSSGQFDVRINVSNYPDMGTSSVAASLNDVQNGTTELANEYNFLPDVQYYARASVYFLNRTTGAYTLVSYSPIIAWVSTPNVDTYGDYYVNIITPANGSTVNPFNFFTVRAVSVSSSILRVIYSDPYGGTWTAYYPTSTPIFSPNTYTVLNVPVAAVTLHNGLWRAQASLLSSDTSSTLALSGWVSFMVTNAQTTQYTLQQQISEGFFTLPNCGTIGGLTISDLVNFPQALCIVESKIIGFINRSINNAQLVSDNVFKLFSAMFPFSIFTHIHDDLTGAQCTATSTQPIVIPFNKTTFTIISTSTIENAASSTGFANFRSFMSKAMYALLGLVTFVIAILVVGLMRQHNE